MLKIFKDITGITAKEEQARIMGTILNRARDNKTTVTEELQKENQFQSVTGTKNKRGLKQAGASSPGQKRN